MLGISSLVAIVVIFHAHSPRAEKNVPVGFSPAAGSVRPRARRARIMKLSGNIFISLAACCNGKNAIVPCRANEREKRQSETRNSKNILLLVTVRMVRAAPILREAEERYSFHPRIKFACGRVRGYLRLEITRATVRFVS